MDLKDNTQGNPANGSESDDFFNALEQDVNSMVQDTPVTEAEVTPAPQDSNNVTAQAEGSQNADIDNLKKRYSDSSREAQGLRAQLNELKPFIPVLDAMKKDSGLVSHVRNYFEKGGAVPGNVKEQLNLDEDFEFDTEDMVADPDSKSRKVFNTMVDGVVQKRANEILQNEQVKAQQAQQKVALRQKAEDFKAKHSMTEEEFSAFVTEAQTKFSQQGLSFDDMYMLVNRGKVNQNVANATKADMLNQMKNVRDIPASQGSSNNAGAKSNQNDDVFEALLSSDGNIEELFG
tara:strand:- start:1515 stop:2384 length:870 start_codon:yes stop_codon:yes gene_type:complete